MSIRPIVIILYFFGGASILNTNSTTPLQEPITLKTATIAPEGTVWFDLLAEIRQDWLDISDGLVELKLYAGGGLGDENDLLTKMRLNQLQAAAISSEGLGYVDNGVWALSIPMLYQTPEELEWYLQQVHDEITHRFEESGFQLLFLMDIGWRYWFSREPVRTPDDLRKLRIYTWTAVDLSSVWNALGFYSVALSSVDVLPGLFTGLVDCIATTPLVAASFQWFGPAKYMTDYKWGALVGGLLVPTIVWEQIPENLRPKLAEAAQWRADEFADRIHQIDQLAIEAMVENGLQVIQITPEEEETWRATIMPHFGLLRGSLVDTTMFDRVFELNEQISAEFLEK